MGRLFRFQGGVHPAQHKGESTGQGITAARLPKRLTLPLHQHIGESPEPVVQVGDQVLKGQVIAKATGYISAPLHAPTSGTVAEVGAWRGALM